MKILIIGSGGREHALAWKIKQSEQVDKIFTIPGNGGTDTVGENVTLKAEDIREVANFAFLENIDLTVVGPEAPLVAGITDEFEKKNLKIFGPSKKAALLEGSKIFAKELMAKYNIPTASFDVFDKATKAAKFIEQKNTPLVIKADGLAAGKGVAVCDTKQEALEAVEEIMVKEKFGKAGRRIIIEEKLIGQEASIIALSDGEDVLVFDSSQDHKQIYDGDKGPNTGGMGAYSPAPVVTKEIFDYAVDKIIRKTVLSMKKEDKPYRGVLYAGIMLTKEGPKALEFNVRFGDPETQALLPRLNSDLTDLILAACGGDLGSKKMDWNKKGCVSVVMASGGYPGDYEKGKEITGLEEVGNLRDIVVFHAGTKKEGGKILTSGGRVLNVSALGDTIKAAQELVYKAVSKIKFDGMYYRKDIAEKAV